jgi:hypothetical protein
MTDQNGKFQLPSGVVPPSPFVPNVEGGPWHCLEIIISYFLKKPLLTGDDSRDKTELFKRQTALRDWIHFVLAFPERNNDGTSHLKWVEKHAGNKAMYHVPFADKFASSECELYDRAAVDALVGAISYDKHALPKAMTMPSVQFGVKQVQKGAKRDIDPRVFADTDPATGQLKPTIKAGRGTNRICEELIEKKQKKRSNKKRAAPVASGSAHGPHPINASATASTTSTEPPSKRQRVLQATVAMIRNI